MTKIIETTVLLTIFAVSTLVSQMAIALAVFGGLTGFVSVYIMSDKLSDFDELLKKQNKAVERLDKRVHNIESSVIDEKE